MPQRTPQRIVTGHDKDGRSIVSYRGWPGEADGKPWRGREGIWRAAAGPQDTSGGADTAERVPRLDPPSGGSAVRFFRIPPLDPNQSEAEYKAQMEAFFKAIGGGHSRDSNARHPAMHKTRTIDYVVLLEGEVTLVLDEEEVALKPFDVVVQRGTNHAWINTGDQPVLAFAVLVDAEIE